MRRQTLTKLEFLAASASQSFSLATKAALYRRFLQSSASSPSTLN